MADETTSTSRFLIPITKIPSFVLIMSPVIIIFILFLTGGHGLNIVPAAMYVAGIVLVFALLAVMRGLMPKREVSDIVKSMRSVCGIFDIGDIRSMPSLRMVFHFFTIAYLAIHIFVLSGLNETDIIHPSIIFSIIALLCIGDVIRLGMSKCFRGRSNLDYFLSFFIGGGLGAGLAFAISSISPQMIFFKKRDLLSKCVKKDDGTVTCNVEKLYLQTF
tara:strand:+ start:157 stop:810 length:654 start_codon:yes stop_codon:yes gene_type:complete